MSYHRFSVEDFVLDKHFRQWVLSPDAASNLFWRGWLQRHPAKRETLQEARAIILNIPRINYGWTNPLEEALWQRIAQDTLETLPVEEARVNSGSTTIIPLHAAAVLGEAHDQAAPKQWNYQQVGRIAATILLILSFGMATYLGSSEATQVPQPTVYLTKTAPLGSKAQFSLPDGTSVVLNAGSSISYAEQFTDQERRIEINGEAFLKVAKDSLHPFRVRTGAVVTEALGTAFNVRYDRKTVEISLLEGKVQVRVDHPDKEIEKLILLPGEQASLREAEHLTKEHFDPEKATAWKDGVIFFESADEQEVINTLQQWYGVKISTEGQASKPWDFTGKFKNKSLEYVLKSIGYSMDFQYTLEKKEVKIIY